MLASFAVPVGVVAILRVRGGWGNLVKADEVLLLLFSASIIAGIDSLYYSFEVRTRRNLLLFFLALFHLLSTIALALIYSNVSGSALGAVNAAGHVASAGGAIGAPVEGATSGAITASGVGAIPSHPGGEASTVLGVYWLIAAASFVICAWYKWANTKTVEDSTIQLPIEVVRRLDQAIREKPEAQQAALRSEFLLVAVDGGREAAGISSELRQVLFSVGSEDLILEGTSVRETQTRPVLTG